MRYTVLYFDVSQEQYDPRKIYRHFRHDLLAKDAYEATRKFHEIYPDKRIYTIMLERDLIHYNRHNCYDMGNFDVCRKCGKFLNRPASWYDTMAKIGWLQEVASDDEFSGEEVSSVDF